jgi:ABC-type Na+ transport system ATPase subunit NatA
MQQLTKEIEAIEAQLAAKKDFEEKLQGLAAKEKQLTLQSVAAQKKQADLQRLTRDLTALAVGSEAVARTLNTIKTFTAKIDTLFAIPPAIESWPREAGTTDRLALARGQFSQVLQSIKNATGELRATANQTEMLAGALSAERVPLEKRARELRKEIDELQQGAGAISRSANQIRERLTQLQALTSLKDEKYSHLSVVQEARGQHLDEMDAIWDRRFKERLAVAKLINSHLSPRIRIKPIRAAQLAVYASAVSSALRGSGLRYNELSMAIASRMSPRELVEIIEQGDTETLAALLDITSDRAIKLIGHLRDHGPVEILTAHVEDDVRLELLDGAEYKDIESLSTGQRCTVVLPIVMEHKDRVLIMDQPEDHLDNAFVVDTLVKAIVNRGSDSQLLLSTHNANIPVLGGAAQVIVMGSDGKRGFIENQGSLDDHSIVRTITSIMEGGADAFQRRAEFYRAHADLNE